MAVEADLARLIDWLPSVAEQGLGSALEIDGSRWAAATGDGDTCEGAALEKVETCQGCCGTSVPAGSPRLELLLDPAAP
jgi:hypothetical protein